GRTNLEAIHAVLPTLSEVRAYDTHPDRARRYAEEGEARYPGLRFVVAPNPRPVVENTDIVVSAGPIKRRPEPAIVAAWFSEGTLGVPLDYDSYWTPEAMRAADRFYTDDAAQLRHAKADGVYFQRIPDIYADLGEVLAGTRDGRRSPKERLICMNLG